MKRSAFVFLLVLVLLSLASCSKGKIYPYRWVYVSKGLHDDRDVEEIREIARTASEHGLDGILLSAGLDRLDLQPPDYFRRLKEVQGICGQYSLDIIPSVFSVGYGSGLGHNKNLAAGFPVKDALFLVKKGEAKLLADPPVAILNGSFEETGKDRVKGFICPADSFPQVIFIDKNVFRDGKSSLRFENGTKHPEQAGRISQEVSVSPYRSYRLTCWIKTEDLDIDGENFREGRFSGNIRLYAEGAEDKRELVRYDPRMPMTGDWRKVSAGFNSLNYGKVIISASALGGTRGRFWLDSLSLEEVGLTNILRRPGTPLVVWSDKDGTVYEEGKDFAPVADPELNCYFDHDGPVIKVLPGGRIKEGERLRVSWYHGMSVPVNKHQVTVCMSEPELYDYWRLQVKLIQENLAPKMYFLPQDEIRAGGYCKACKERNMTMGQILGDCITRQCSMIKEVNPQAKILAWSDMLDPNHNAGPKVGKYYYLVDGLFDGSWNYVPKDLIMACWGRSASMESLEHFSGLGFRILGAAYYDTDDLKDVKGWLEALDKTPTSCGIMYTTWQDKYALLAEFGDMVSKR